MVHRCEALAWSRTAALSVLLAIVLGQSAHSQTCSLTIASAVQFDTPITWTPPDCTSTVQGYENGRLVGQVKQIRSGDVMIGQISTGTSPTLGVKLWPLSGPQQSPMEIPVVIDDCRTPRLAISSVPSPTTRVCWTLPNCTATVEALQEGAVVSRFSGVKSCEKTIAELTNGLAKPTELRLYATPTSPVPAESRLVEPSNSTPAVLSLFQDDFRQNKGWLDFITEEIVTDTCYNTGAAKVGVSNDLASGAAGQTLRAEANWKGLDFSNHVIVGNRILDSGQSGRWIYRFNFYLPSATAGSGQSGPEVSIQDTVDGTHTYIAGLQFQSNPEALPENRDAWAIWVRGEWVVMAHQALVRDRWYTAELEADFESKEYVRFSVKGEGLELRQELAGQSITVESRGFDPAFVITLEVENQWTCGAPRPTSNVVYYKDVELVRLPESDHPYDNNSDTSWSYTNLNAAALRVTFDPRTSVENGADFIHLTDGNGVHIPGSPFTGMSLAGQTKTVPGDTVRIRLVADRRNADFGFKVSDIAAVVTPPPPIGPDLTISKTHSGIFSEGQAGMYLVQVRNTGSGATNGPVFVVDTLPAGLTGNGMTGAGWTCTQPAGPCTRADVLAPGSGYPPLELKVTVGSNAAPGVINSAVVSGGGDTNPDNNRADDPTMIVPPQVCPPLESDHPYPNNLDNTWTCTIPHATSLEVTFDPRTSVEIGADFIYVLDGNGLNIPGSPFTGTSLAGKTHTVQGNTARIRLVTDRRNGDFGFVATVRDVSGPVPAGPDLTITKTHAGNFTRGEAGTYSIEVRNVGTGITSGIVSVTDTVPAGLTGAGITGAAWDCAQPAGPCTRMDALPPGSAYPPLRLTVNVNSGAPSVVTNSATVSGGGDETPVNNTANDRTLIPSSPSCTLPESEHPYGSSLDTTWTCTIPNATALEVRFDPRTSVESGSDFIYVMDGNGLNIHGSPFTGTSLAGRSKTVPGNTVKIRLATDRRGAGFGFKVSAIAPWGIAVGEQRVDAILDAFNSPWVICCTADPSIPSPVVRVVEDVNGNAMEVGYDLTNMAPPDSNGYRQSWVVLQRQLSTAEDFRRFTHLRVALKGSNPKSHDNIEIKLRDSRGLFAVSLKSMTDLPVWRPVYIDLREFTGDGGIDLEHIVGLEIAIVRCDGCEVFDNPSVGGPQEEHSGTLSIRELAAVDLKPGAVNRLFETDFESVESNPTILADTANALLARIVQAEPGAGLIPAWFPERYPNFNSYAQAEALLVFTYEFERTGNPAFRNAARNMAARLLALQIPPGTTQAGAWYTGYGVQNGVLTPPHRAAPATQICDGNESMAENIDACEWVGNVGWLLIALERLQRSGIYDDPVKLQTALERGAAWIAGQPQYRANPGYPDLISLGTEGNISAYFGLLAAGKRSDAARLGSAIFGSAWDNVQRRLKPGVGPSDAATAMDVAGSWGVTFLRSIGRLQEALESQSYAASILRVCSFDGYTCAYGDIAGPYTPAVEFTAQAAAAGIKDADFVMREILKLQQGANDPYPKAFPGAANHWYGGQLTPWNTTMPGVSPTAWVYFAFGNRDPLVDILMRQ